MMNAILSNQQGIRAGAIRVGIPYRTAREEASGENRKHDYYCQAVRDAGGEPVAISLNLDDARLTALLHSLDAFVTPGSPADVDPARYGAPRHPMCGDPDPARERTDWALYEHAFAEQKPVLAICYGVQSLNVFLGGTLVQDIPSEIPNALRHSKNANGEVMPAPSQDPVHGLQIEAGTKLAEFSGALETRVNTSHHQAIRTPGRGLQVTAKAPDGIIEAVEYVAAGNTNPGGEEHWILGVQWHPERLIHEAAGDAFSAALFHALVRAAVGVAPQAT
ncbi:MAG TPA: gamma-glutamyl-gamma-aminobutyrate hydrolase family protein [Candidatus Acidoferrum sp.]|nr:gamma-glutamyl-gamma-aminobutyrate hydrolase family protein [Candidatus Acidoferrum sp.]